MEELTFTMNFDVIHALSVFNNLRRLELKDNQIFDTLHNKFCSYISHLEFLDLSQNRIDFGGNGPCKSLPQLKTLRVADNKASMATDIPVLCQMSPALEEIDLSGVLIPGFALAGGNSCPRLTTYTFQKQI